MMVGNGCTLWDLPEPLALPETVFKFNMIPPKMMERFEEHGCRFSVGRIMQYDNPKICYTTYAQMEKQLKNTNIYDLYRRDYDILSAELGDEPRLGSSIVGGEEKTYKRGYTASEYTSWLNVATNDNELILGSPVSDYLNRADVRTALHIPDSAPAYEECSSTLDYHMQQEGSIWIYKVLRNKLRILKYSGDTDGAVPTWDTKQWIKSLEWESTDAWRPWFTDG